NCTAWTSNQKVISIWINLLFLFTYVQAFHILNKDIRRQYIPPHLIMALCTEKGMVKLKKSVIYILLGAALWGTIGWYVKHLNDLGFNAMEVVTIRVSMTAIFLIKLLYFNSPDVFKLHIYIDII